MRIQFFQENTKTLFAIASSNRLIRGSVLGFHYEQKNHSGLLDIGFQLNGSQADVVSLKDLRVNKKCVLYYAQSKLNTKY